MATLEKGIKSDQIHESTGDRNGEKNEKQGEKSTSEKTNAHGSDAVKSNGFHTTHHYYPSYQTQPELDYCNVFVKYLPPDVTDATLHALFSPYGKITSAKVMIDYPTGNSLGFGFVRFSTPAEAQNAIANLSGHKIANKTLLCKLSNSAPPSSDKASRRGSSTPYYGPMYPDNPAHRGLETYMPASAMSSSDMASIVNGMDGLSMQDPYMVQNSPNQNILTKDSNILPPEYMMGGEEFSYQVDPTNLYIKSLGKSVTEEKLREIFAPFGTIIEGKVMIDKRTGQSRQIGFVRYLCFGCYLFLYDFLDDLTFETEGQAGKALQAMNGAKLDPASPPLIVKYAETPEQKAFRKSRRYYPNYVLSPELQGYYPTYPYYADHGMVTTSLECNQYPTHSFSCNSSIFSFTFPQDYSSRSNSGSASGGDEANLFCFHLPSDLDDAGLFSLFAPFGAVRSVKVITDKENGESKGYGFVRFFRIQDAANALKCMNGYKIGSKFLKVSFKTNRPV